MWKQYLLNAIFLTFCGQLVYGGCYFDSEPGKEPTIIRNLGLQQILTSKKSRVNLEYDEVIDVSCATGLRFYRNNYEQSIIATNLKLLCKTNGYLSYATPDMSSYKPLEQTVYKINCDSASGIQLYESKSLLPNCYHTTLGVGIKVTNLTSIIYGGLCYDWTTLDLKYVNYQAYLDPNILIPQQSYEYLDSDNLQTFKISLDVKLPKYDAYFNFVTDEDLKKNPLVERFNFEYNSIVQDLSLRREFKEYNNLLNIIWWRNLRLANWATFLKLLQERSEVIKYNIYTGTSGAVEIPLAANACYNNETLSVATSDGIRKTAPAYIWSYLKPMHDSDTEEFVIIGYNSPFSNSDESIRICQDMCNQIPWLRRFDKVRQMATLGLVFCCHPADVAYKLDNFPISVLNIPEETTTITQSNSSTETQTVLAKIVLND